MANKNVKAKKVNKKSFNWNKVFFYAKSLFNNGIVKEIGIRHWISSIFIFLIAVFISVIPVLTTEATRSGSSTINSAFNDVLVESLYNYVNDEDSPDFKIENHKASLTNGDGASSIFTYEREGYRMDYYFFDTTEGNPTLQDQANSVLENNPNIQSHFFISTSAFQVSIINPSTGSSVGQANGGFNHIENIPSFKEYIKEGVDTSLPLNEVKTAYNNKLNEFFDLGYLDLRGQQVGMAVGICLGINAGITIIVIPVLFLLTRGKNNPNRSIKFYQVMGIGFHATLSPAIIALILGYIMGGSFQYMTMLYVMCYGFRAMWLAMKYLRPPVE